MIYDSIEKREKVNEYIKNIIADEAYIYDSTSKTVEGLINTFADACEGGKRLRAMLVLLGYRLAGNKDENLEIYKAAAAYEIFQTAILIHDDVIDASELRRGKPTVHVALGNDHLAKSNAVCLGDFGIFLTQKVLGKLEIEPEILVRAMRIYNKTLMNTIAGELLDVNSPYSKHVSKDRILNIAYLKTAWYTIIGPMLLGAILGGASEELTLKIEEFGKHVGIAFQLKDDILGIFGEEEVVGKSITSDIAEKKLTLLYLYVLEEGNMEQLEIFNAYYGKQNVTEAECKIIRDIMNDLDVVSKVEKILKEEMELAKQMVESLTTEDEMRKELDDFINFLTSRKK